VHLLLGTLDGGLPNRIDPQFGKFSRKNGAFPTFLNKIQKIKISLRSLPKVPFFGLNPTIFFVILQNYGFFIFTLACFQTLVCTIGYIFVCCAFEGFMCIVKCNIFGKN